MPADDAASLCESCRLTHVIPDLAGRRTEAWYRLEVAKRRLVYTLLALDCRAEPARGSRAAVWRSSSWPIADPDGAR